VWPLNPDGELLLGLKLEDKYALANAEANLEIPGIAFAEWGPGDMQLSLNVKSADAPEMRAARNRVFAATKSHKIFFLETMNEKSVVAEIKEGVRVGPASPAAAEIGRKFQNRQMPW
jgi:4-hydroxy-2-oxoheptanedioate aldolase